MTLSSMFSNTRSALGKMLLGGIVVILLGTASARASLIVSVQSATVTAGSTDNGLDVQLSNSGTSAVTIAGFSFSVMVANPAISFVDANTSTSVAYIFGGNSLFGPDLTGPTSGESLSTSDVFATLMAGATLGAGTTVGLGHLVFDVSPGAAGGVIPVTLAAFPASSLSDPAGNDVSIQTLSSGQITISGTAAVPEPSTMAMLMAAGVVLMARSARVRARLSRGLRC